MGIRSRRELAPIVFVSGLAEAAVHFLDHLGVVVFVRCRGFFPMLEPLFGAHAFDTGGVGGGGGHFGRFVSVSTDLGTAFAFK